MTRTGVTEKQVHDAADALLRAGDRPTIERVRTLLGTGSPNTLIRLLDSWWIELGARLAAQEKKLALPDAPPEVVNAASALWTGALAHAKALAAEELERDRAQFEKQRSDWGQSEGERRAQLDAATKEASQAREAQARAETRYTDVERLAEQLAAQLEDLKGQRLTLGRERDQLGSRLAVTEQRLVDQAAKWAAERLALDAQFRASEDRWLQDVDRSRQQVNMLQKRLGKAEEVARAESARSLRELEAVQGTLRASERVFAASESRAAALEQEVKRLHERLGTPATQSASARKPTPPPKSRASASIEPTRRKRAGGVSPGRSK